MIGVALFACASEADLLAREAAGIPQPYFKRLEHPESILIVTSPKSVSERFMTVGVAMLLQAHGERPFDELSPPLGSRFAIPSAAD